jgi:hypothetical protein
MHRVLLVLLLLLLPHGTKSTAWANPVAGRQAVQQQTNSTKIQPA